jgi:hypothetical protein
MPGSKFEYRGRSAETVKARANQKSGDFDSFYEEGTPKFKVPEGDNQLRILPATWNSKQAGDNWAIELWVHYNIGADNQAYLCPRKMKEIYPKFPGIESDECCLCDAVADMDREEAKNFKAKKRMIAYVIDREKEKDGPLVWELGVKAEKDIQKRCIDKNTGEVLPIDHPDEGYDISFTREGKDKENTQYFGWDIARKPTSISEKDSRYDAWLEYIEENPLPDVLVFHDQEHVNKVFMGRKTKKKDDDDEDKPRRSSGRKRDEDDDDGDSKSTRRRSTRDDGDDKDRPRRRSREDEDDDGDRSSRRRSSKDDDDDGDKDRPRRRSSRDDDDGDSIDDSRETLKENSKRERRSRGRDEDDDGDSDRGSSRRRSSRDDDDDDKGKTSSRRRSSRDDDDDDGDKRSSRRSRDDDDDGDSKSSRRRSSRDDDDGEEEGSGKTNRAKKSLDRLKSRRDRD